MNILFRSGSCLDVFGAEPDASFDCFVSDWPAGVAFMSRSWDKDHGGREAWVRVWAEHARMMRKKAKPGAYSLTWALPRTAHWTAAAIEDGGWFVQDVVTHIFGQGWPKGRAALKPASEHWILARNGGGGKLQIDAARVERGEPISADRGAMGYGQGGERVSMPPNMLGSWPPNFTLSHCPDCEERGTRRVKAPGWSEADRSRPVSQFFPQSSRAKTSPMSYGSDGSESVPAFDCLAACDCGLSLLSPSGGEAPRCACGAAMWWACPVAEMDGQSGTLTSGSIAPHHVQQGGTSNALAGVSAGRSGRDIPGDSGGASRFFPRFTYQAKASGGERHAGCDGLYWRADKRSPFGFVKSLALMEWLVSLVCPPGGRVGDMTAGSGGTGIAVHRLNVAKGLGASFLGSDICPEAVEIAEARLAWWRSNTAVQEGLWGERTVIEPEAKKPAVAKPAPAPKAPPLPDPRQEGLFR